jgi:hypothetical protein
MPLERSSLAIILKAVAPYTMVPPSAIEFSITQMLAAIDAGLPGVVVECGTWKGGCSFALLLAQRAAYGQIRRPVYMLDSFEGLPQAEERDGPLALSWQNREMPEIYFDNCAAEEAEVRSAIGVFGFGPGECKVVRGWFDQTVPALASELAATGIAFLRLDGDWFSSTKVCLDHLMPLVAEGSTVVVDDYYAWDGCARAVHAHFAEHDVAYRLRSLPLFECAYFVRKSFRDGISAA